MMQRLQRLWNLDRTSVFQIRRRRFHKQHRFLSIADISNYVYIYNIDYRVVILMIREKPWGRRCLVLSREQRSYGQRQRSWFLDEVAFVCLQTVMPLRSRSVFSLSEQCQTAIVLEEYTGLATFYCWRKEMKGKKKSKSNSLDPTCR